MSEVKDKELNEANVTGGCLGIVMRETDRRCRCGAKIIDEYLKASIWSHTVKMVIRWADRILMRTASFRDSCS